MELEIEGILKEHSIALVFAAIFSIVGLSLRLARSIYDFYDEYIVGASTGASTGTDTLKRNFVSLTSDSTPAASRRISGADFH